MLSARLPRVLLAAMLGIGGAGLAAPSVHAAAAPTAPTAPTAPKTPAPPSATVRADVLPAPQINGVVWKQVIAGDTVIAGGEFSNARPFRAAPGHNTLRRTNILAYSLSTGALKSFAPSVNGAVKDMAVTPDGTKLVIVGTFTKVSGATRNRVAVFDLKSMTLNSAVHPSANNIVRGVAATNSTIFLGGSFSGVNGTARSRAAAVSAKNGSLLPFVVPVDNGQVNTLVVSPDGNQVVLGGNFTSVGKLPHVGFGLYRAEASTGTMLPLPVNEIYRNAGAHSGVTRLASDATSFYGAGSNHLNGGGGGNSEGVFQADWATGSLLTLTDCHGDSHDVAPIGAVFYVASHSHKCSTSGGFPERNPRIMWHSTAWTKTPAGVNTPALDGYPDHTGTPRSQILPWMPRWKVGTFTGQLEATRTVTGNADYVLYGGEFLAVNGVAQQGIARFAVRSIAPNKSGPKAPMTESFVPTAQPNLPGAVQVSWPAAWDADDFNLTYRLLRNGTNVYETSQVGYEWTGTDMNYVDSGLTAGSKVTYVVQAIDPDGNVLTSKPVTATVGSTVKAPTAPTAPTTTVPAAPTAPAAPKTPASPKAPAQPKASTPPPTLTEQLGLGR